jgi:Domain of unknown function (DUF1963)
VATNRRNFLRELAGQVSRGAGELIGQAINLDPTRPTGPDAAPTSWEVPAPAPARCASLDEVYALADELGLDRHRDATLSICRWSLRLTALDSGDVESPSDDSALLKIDLAWLAALGESGLVPEDGVLRFYDGRPPEYAPAPDTLGGSAALAGGHQLEANPELVLPPSSADAVSSLGLDDDELAAWETLRRRLDELQTGNTSSWSGPPSHRVLGYPDDDPGNMALACEMLAHRVDPGAARDRAGEFEAGAGRWLLLAALGADASLGWSWGAAWERRYFWIHEADLAARRFERVRTFTQ